MDNIAYILFHRTIRYCCFRVHGHNQLKVAVFYWTLSDICDISQWIAQPTIKLPHYPLYGYWGTLYIYRLSKKCWAPGYGYINAGSCKNDAPLLDSTIPGLFDFFIKLYFAVLINSQISCLSLSCVLINSQISCLSLSCVTPSFVKLWPQYPTFYWFFCIFITN